MRTAKRVTPIMDGINRRFFAAVDALVTTDHVNSLEGYAKNLICMRHDTGKCALHTALLPIQIQSLRAM
jgi:hypothetical protein